MFGTTGQCAGCGQGIPADELVMRCQGSVYHVRCFTCVQCHGRLQPGDKFSMVNGSLFCEHEFPKIFGGVAGAGGAQQSGTAANGPATTGTGRGRQKKVDSRRYPLPVC